MDEKDGKMAMAARSGNLDLVQWLRGEGCPWDWTTCHFAVRYGKVEVLRWVRENGCPWTAETRDEAGAELGTPTTSATWPPISRKAVCRVQWTRLAFRLDARERPPPVAPRSTRSIICRGRKTQPQESRVRSGWRWTARGRVRHRPSAFPHAYGYEDSDEFSDESTVLSCPPSTCVDTHSRRGCRGRTIRPQCS